ncbi:hypothetical protein T06_1258 [Trichinella sp. T6]|nr:hypothetical protein T06_1258 [Trichinella sp. T6]
MVESFVDNFKTNNHSCLIAVAFVVLQKQEECVEGELLLFDGIDSSTLHLRSLHLLTIGQAVEQYEKRKFSFIWFHFVCSANINTYNSNDMQNSTGPYAKGKDAECFLLL